MSIAELHSKKNAIIHAAAAVAAVAITTILLR